ncbi:sensor histidine kinase [Kitasatospora sp. McL0602]|uniref:sensor histidine kinase n=1 Tax=Kitasatospora sp. McL0602 TaxID=3439530 RepID=UPI003F88EA66
MRRAVRVAVRDSLGSVKAWQGLGLTPAQAERLREQGRLEERVRVARDVHDTVAQSLSALTLMIRAAEHALPAEERRVRERLGAAYETAVLGLGQSHDLIGGIAASQLLEGGLAPALERFVGLSGRHLTALRQLREARQGGVGGYAAVPELRLRVVGVARRLALPAESAALRMVHEAVANAVKHAGAATITVELRHLADRVRVAVRDDGAGMAARPGSRSGGGGGSGLGLAGMAQRVGRFGGRMLVESPPGGGTVVTVEFQG